jgi:hypothetical protein
MKTLFITVSIVAAVYLAVQTLMQSNMVKMFSDTVFVKSESAQKNAFVKPVLSAAPSVIKADNGTIETHTDSNLALTKNLEDENKRLVSRIEKLEKNVIELTNKLSKDALSPLNETQASLLVSNSNSSKNKVVYQSASKEPKLALTAAAKPIGLQEKPMKETLVKTNPLAGEQSKQKQQQKRLQQQAVLRELANKLELTALSSLTN